MKGIGQILNYQFISLEKSQISLQLTHKQQVFQHDIKLTSALLGVVQIPATCFPHNITKLQDKTSLKHMGIYLKFKIH